MSLRSRRAVAPLLACMLLTACGLPRTQPSAPTIPAPPVAPAVPVKAAEPKPVERALVGEVGSLPGWPGMLDDKSLAAFRRGCPALLKRVDRSGLTTADDWAGACADTEVDARRFFERHFLAIRLNDGRGLATGYFEPEIAGCLAPTSTCATPIYRKPDDLLEIDLGSFNPDLKGRSIRGRWNGKAFVPYPDRGAIADGALAGRGLELAWATDPIELFFLEIQGSGRLSLPDGRVLRIGYAGQNGRPYVPIGRLLRERGQLPSGGAGMEAIIAWIRADPAAGAALMRENPSYVFFRKLPDELDGPIGALGVPLLAERTAAADPAVLPLGAPVLLSTRIAEPGGTPASWTRLLIVQDTGGAIRGPNRFDIFWGAGRRAGAIAGSLAAPAEAVILLPRSAAERLNAPTRR